ncbi:DUF1499 domain-containing protein [Aureimonas sp. ME7]|uniref:DUF1499 domain-containing protein n=1 Tax=Aureimonas sp. ME7 TaxID=2744252 RepID=UPI0015F3E3B8|nr:DUF1499 domain-containing protein [Aureimonas sp. ME7]
MAGGLAALGWLLAAASIGFVWIKGALGGGRAIAALLLATLVLVPFAGAAYLYHLFPSGAAAETAGLGEATAVTGAAGDERPLIPGRDYQATASMVYEAARTAIEGAGMEIVDVRTSAMPPAQSDDLGISGTVSVPVPTLRSSLPDESSDPFAIKDAGDYTIQAVAYAPLFAFPSDVTIRIAEDGAQTFVDMRSESRTLDMDLGQNRRFVAGFLARLDEAMRAAEGVVSEE